MFFNILRNVAFLCLILLLQTAVQGIPIPIEFSHRAEPGGNGNTDSGQQHPAKRTLFNIAWSCGWTTIICAWVSVHPNVPPSGQWKALWRRLKMMFWTMVAPELILAWAVRQWNAAWVIRDTVNGVDEGLFTGLIRACFRRGPPQGSGRWTMEHGHLLAMGGINTVDPSFEHSVDSDPRGRVLTIEKYDELIRTDGGAMLNLKLQKISEADIKDRSKGDFLSKLIAILQTTWFILQCVARGRQRLAITELELVTLALASLNAVTYAFWWHKPLGVQEPIRIYFDDKAEEDGGGREDMSEDGEPGVSARYIVSQVGVFLRNFAEAIVEFFQDPCQEGGFALLISLPFFVLLLVLLVLFLPFPLGITLLLKILRTKPVVDEPVDKRIAARIVRSLQNVRFRITSYISSVSEKWLRRLLDDGSVSGLFIGWFFIVPVLFLSLLAITILLFPFFALLFLVSFIFTAVFGIITSNATAPGAPHVPAFYAPRTKSDKYSRMVVFALFGVIFGGLHCIGWNFTYPTAFERRLWRGASLAITVIPFIVAPIDYILENVALEKGFLKVVRLTLDLVMTILLFVYVPARLSLIAQALALLRNQPETAFVSVDWTQFIPHIF